MALTVLRTGDQSDTIYNPELDETYHSRNGALQESMHVFIEAGFREAIKNKQQLALLEVGFGTGLNAILTLAEAQQAGVSVQYHGIEAYPLPLEMIHALNYKQLIPQQQLAAFERMHLEAWNQPVDIAEGFTLHKHHIKLEDFIPARKFDLVYFDAFAPDKQPALWTPEQFTKLYLCLNPGGILVTYSSKGEVKRTLRNTGFEVFRLPGPPFKRHMLKAVKN